MHQSRTHGRVLVIDDEAALARAIGRSLRVAVGALNHHIEVVAVDRAQLALDLILGGGDFDVILCDVMMPEMDGLAFHAQLVERAPTFVERVIFLTGASYLAPLEALVQKWGNVWLPKPIDLFALRALVSTRIQARLALRPPLAASNG